MTHALLVRSWQLMRAAQSLAQAPRALRGLALLGLLLGPSCAQAGQGMYLDVRAYVPSPLLTIDSSRCVDPGPSPILDKIQYIEASNGFFCLSSASGFSLTLWSGGDKVASYDVIVSARGSKVHTTYANPSFAEAATLYPHYGISGDQDRLYISATSQNLASWMHDINPDLQIRQLVLPGTHDSGTADITSRSAVTADANSAIAAAAIAAPWAISRWSKTQFVDVAGQLQRGIRYFDLRLCGGNDVDSVYTCHALAGQKLTRLIEQVRDFVNAHPDELVLLDMSHWYSNSGSHKESMRNSVYQYVQQQLGSRLASRTRFGPTSTLRELQAAGRTVIVASDQTAGQPDWWKSTNTTDLSRCGAATDICSYCVGADAILTTRADPILTREGRPA